MRAVEGCIHSPVPEGLSEGHPQTAGRLGADGHLLRLSEGALGSPSDDERGRVSLQCHSVTNGCSEAVQKSRKCYRHDLEAAHGCGKRVSYIERLPVTSGSVCRRSLCRWSESCQQNIRVLGKEGRLKYFYTPIDKTS